MHTTDTNRTVVWVLIAIAVLANAAGYIWSLFGRISWYDEVVHAYTMFAITLFVALLLYSVVLTGKHDHGGLLVLTITLVGLGIGGLWEIGEWAYDEFFAEQQNVIRGKTDTIIDLIMDTLGAFIAGITAAAMAEPYRTDGRAHVQPGGEAAARGTRYG